MINKPTTLDDQISALTDDVSESVRKGLQEALCTLRDAGSVSGALTNVARLFEGESGFLATIADFSNYCISQESIKDGLYKQIIELERNKILTKKIVPDLHLIRRYANKVRHGSEEKFTITDAETVLERALFVVEWFYCRYEDGRCLSSIYAAAFEPVTLLEQIAKFDVSSAKRLELMTSTLALDMAGNPRVRKGADLNQLKAEPGKLRDILKRWQSDDAEKALYTAYWASIDHDFHGRRNEARRVLSDVLKIVFADGQDTPVEWQIRVLDRASHLANKLADCAQAEEFAKKMLELSEDVEQSFDAAIAFQRLGRTNYFRCDSELARGLLEKSLFQFQTLDLEDSKETAWVEFDLGMLEVDLGNFTAARKWLEKSLELQEKYGKENEEGTVLVNLAFVIHKQGDWKTARAHLEKAANILRKQNYNRWYYHFLGRLEIDEGNFGLARVHLSEGLKIFHDKGDTLGIIRSLLGFSLLAAKEGNWGKATVLLAAEDTLRNEMVGLPFPLDWETERRFVETDGYETLGSPAFNSAWERGRAMTLEQAIESSLA